MVDHAHKYLDGTVGEHMHCHMYTDAVEKQGGKQCCIPFHENIGAFESP